MVVYRAAGYADCEAALQHARISLYERDLISDAEYCALFFATLLSKLYGPDWIGGAFPSPIASQDRFAAPAPRCGLASSSTDSSYSEYLPCADLLDCRCRRHNLTLGQLGIPAKKGIDKSQTLLGIFQRFALKGISYSIQRSICLWGFAMFALRLCRLEEKVCDLDV